MSMVEDIRLSRRSFVDRGFPHAGYGQSWYQVGWSQELAPGAVRPLRCFGHDLVIYRTGDGQAVVMDAHCVHYGAHLGYGGTVEGSTLRCPYHGWAWDDAGRNVEVPYGDGRCSKRVLRTWPIREQSGVLYVWYASDGSEPTWEPPSLPLDLEPGYFALYPGGTYAEAVSFPGQYVVENMADLAHLKYVHRFAEIPDALECTPRGHIFRTVFDAKLPGSQGHVQMRLTQEAHGIGLIRTKTSGAVDSIGLTSMTPIDDATTMMRFSRWTACPDKEAVGQQPTGKALKAFRDNIAEGLGPDSDRPIWENMRYMQRPALTRDEVTTLRAIRNWAEQFYDAPKSTKPTAGDGG